MMKLRILCLLFGSSLLAQVQIAEVLPNPVASPSFQLLAPGSYAICYDINMSPYAGGEDLLFATRLIETCFSSIASKMPISYSKSMYARALRLAELSLVWLPLNYFAMEVQHEVFGHGYRIRDINHGKVKVTDYDFDGPPPYGSGGAATFFSISKQLTTTDMTCISMAGIESSQILSQLTQFKWLGSRTVDPRQTILYLVNRYNLNLYASSIEGDEIEGHDLSNYVRFLNYTYSQKRLNVSDVRNLAWINLVDPFTYYALFAWFHYLSSGKETGLPMIPIKEYGYLFGAHLNLTPFGPEYSFDNYLLKGSAPIYFYLKSGWHAGNTYEGIGIFAKELWTFNKFSIGIRSDLWRQPKLLLTPADTSIIDIDLDSPPNPETPLYPSSEQHRKQLGFAFSTIGTYQVNRVYGFQAELGYKTRGFLPGYSLYSSPVVRISYLINF